MVASQKQKLFAYTGRYLSIGITEDGEPRRAISVPWERTVHAFNMRTPDVYFAREDFEQPEIMERLKEFCVLGCYIFTPLPDYDFLAQFPDIRDMSIRKGNGIHDLSFMRKMKNWFMLFLEDAQLKDLNDLFPEDRAYDQPCSRCLGFYHCRVEDISAMTDKQIYLSELLVWPANGNSDDKAGWKAARAGLFRYYSETDNRKAKGETPERQ